MSHFTVGNFSQKFAGPRVFGLILRGSDFGVSLELKISSLSFMRFMEFTSRGPEFGLYVLVIFR